uniref:Tetratricopeptide repeat-containing protein n=1 Tax=Candidatus Kentrum sp. FW TaxID=2126338 RepID=A0A450SN43_9GAMM|nr:MAG: hypothetical protein BECKFW1821B_GA0114236_102129 [Candidatus Kentron sp. FW]
MDINETLDKARSQSAERTKTLIIRISIAVILCGVFIVGISFIDFSAPPPTAPTTSSPSRITPKQPEELPVATVEEGRERFKERLGRYENQLAPRLQGANLEAWNQDASSEIEDLKRAAIAHFTAHDYTSALTGMGELEEKAKSVLAKRDRIFADAIEKATAFLNEWQYDEARLHMEKALSVYPGSAPALDLQKKIEALPDILPLLETAKVARAENNLQKEHDALSEALKLVPDRQEIASRVRELARVLDDRAFSRHISEGLSGIEKRQVKKAEHHYQAAKRIYPAREELSLLAAKLSTLKKSIRFENAFDNAGKAIRQDNWHKARIYFSQAEKEFPGDSRVVEGLRRAGEILSLKKTLAGYMAQPYRLKNSKIRSQAETALSASDAISKYSFSLKKQAEEIADLIVKVNGKVSVNVISDNKTYVRVRGVGNVGVISRKTIRIKPGRYTFEGMRDGFKSKLVEVTIPYDQNDFSVRVICDEPI